jgi:hypothetical protein
MWRILCAVGLISFLLLGCKDNSTKPSSRSCANGTVRWVNGHCYEAVLSPGFTWYDAQAACEARGGHLVTITSKAENDFVFSLVSGNNAFWLLDSFGNGLGPWLGGYQDANATAPDSGWHWVTGERWSYTNWAEGQPGDLPQLEQDGLRFFMPGGLIGPYWDDSERYNPVEHRKGYICEYE